jgi:Peptidase family M28
MAQPGGLLLEREIPGIRRILFALTLAAAILVLSLFAVRPPAPRSSDTPVNQFSAVRARDVLFQLVGDDMPHPIGSPQNDVVRGRIIDILTRLGYDPQVQTGFACDEFGTCGTVKNVLARLAGTEPSGPAVLLVAHYDSVPAGPGASDDGAGVAAVLEIARALKSMSAPRHSIILMIDDGEEAGLLGAHAFVDGHPWAKEVAAAINLEARGSSGPSLMFETGSANAWVVRLFAHSVWRPATSSVSYAVYKMLPNDTDFTVFKAAGYQGLNFAYVDDVVHYHTPLDDFENANAASLQHHGDNALPSLVALANTDLNNIPAGEAVYFDLFERWIARWPLPWTLPLSIVALLLLGFQVFWLIRSKRMLVTEFLWGLLAWIVALLATGVLAVILMRIVHTVGATPANWVAHPQPLELAMWSLALAAVITHAIVFTRKAAFWGIWAGTFIWMAVLAIAVSWMIPAVGFILVVTAWAAAISGLPYTLKRTDDRSGALAAVGVPLAAAAISGFSLVLTMYATLGIEYLPEVAVVAALLLSPIMAVCTDLRDASGIPAVGVPGIPVIVTIAALFISTVVPAFSAKAPERVNIQYWVDADAAKSQWIVRPNSGRLPEPIRLAANFHEVSHGPFPWERQAAFLADAPHLDLAPPTFTILNLSVANGKRAYTALLRSERGAPQAMVFFPPDSGIADLRAEESPMPIEESRVQKYLNGWSIFNCVTMTPKGVTIHFTLPEGKPVEVYAVDQTFQLPDEGNFLLKSRPLTATRSQDGDVTIASRRVQLNP